MLVEIRGVGRRYHLAYVLEGRDPQKGDLTGKHVQVKTDSTPNLYDRLNISWEHVTHVYPAGESFGLY